MLEAFIDIVGDFELLAISGLLTGLIFGAAAQHSRFCLRAATTEVAHGAFGSRMAIWLVAFFSALLATQLAISSGFLDASQSRQISAEGSLSGAVVGGLLFGVGMILARGCASRLLVLSATGNLRALLTGLIVTLVAQASLTGVLAPLREGISMLVRVDGGEARDLMELMGISRGGVFAFAGLGIVGAVWLALRERIRLSRVLAAAILGLAVALGWCLTYAISTTSFEIVPVGSVTFTGPSTDTLMTLVSSRSIVYSFGVGLVPGVFLGSMVAALLSREWKIERFEPSLPMERYIVGAIMMGFGAMLAGGCAVGAGVTGGAVMSLTAWVAIAFMWVGAVVTELVLSNRSGKATQTA